jgi:hypothetical protein
VRERRIQGRLGIRPSVYGAIYVYSIEVRSSRYAASTVVDPRLFVVLERDDEIQPEVMHHGQVEQRARTLTWNY